MNKIGNKKIAYKREYVYLVYYSFDRGTGYCTVYLTTPIEKRLDLAKKSIIENDKEKNFKDINITDYKLLRIRRMPINRGSPVKMTASERCARCVCSSCRDCICVGFELYKNETDRSLCTMFSHHRDCRK